MRSIGSFLKRNGVSVLVVALMVLALGGAILLQYSLDSSPVTMAKWSDTSPVDTLHSLVDVFGGIRQSVAAYLWAKTDDVFHEYLGGTLESERALFPYFWLITRLDTHFTMPFNFASYTLCLFGRVKEGFDLALGGLRDNPDSALLQKNLAEIYLFYLKDPAKARYHLQKAVSLYKDPGDKSVAQNLLQYTDDVITGKKKIHEPPPLKVHQQISKEAEEHEHEHEVHEH